MKEASKHQRNRQKHPSCRNSSYTCCRDEEPKEGHMGEMGPDDIYKYMKILSYEQLACQFAQSVAPKAKAFFSLSKGSAAAG